MIDDCKARRYSAAMTQPASPLPDEVTAFRKARAMTQAEAASVAGVHMMTWGKWERGVMPCDPYFWRVLLAREVLATPGDATGKLASVAHVIEHGSLEAAV